MQNHNLVFDPGLTPLDRTSQVPLFRQLYLRLKKSILHGQLKPGTRLPATRELSRTLGISRQTVIAAYDQLTAEGFLCGSIGQGTFVDTALPNIHAELSKDKDGLLHPFRARGLALASAMSRIRYSHGPVRAFRSSMPGLDLFPFDVWRKLELNALRRPGPHMGYTEPAGFLPLRELICAYLRSSRGVNCVPEQILITSGSQQALYLLAQVLLEPGDDVWVESPGYQGACSPISVAGARICSVPVNREGMDVAYGAAHFPYARMVFANPSHQLPLGVTMSLSRRLELLRWAGENKAWIIEDDYDSEYRYTSPPLASLQSLDRSNCVIYVGTLSKVLFPGLRLGYVVSPLALSGPLAQAKAVIDRASPIIPQVVLAEFIGQGHFARHIRRTREAYSERRDALLKAIDERLADRLRSGPSDAGLDLCVHFLHDSKGNFLSEGEVAHAALESGVEVRPLSTFVNDRASSACHVDPGLFLGFSSIRPEDIRTGIDKLMHVFAQFR